MLYIWGAIFTIIGIITLGSVIRGMIDGFVERRYQNRENDYTWVNITWHNRKQIRY